MRDDDGEHLSEMAGHLAELKRKAAAEVAPLVLPEELPVGRIRRLPELFQQREGDENERHLGELMRAVKDGRMLDPVLVVQVGEDAFLIDGHHRCTAYERAEVARPVPVRYFQGSLEEAVLESGRANSKAKQPMTTEERQNLAWRLVRERVGGRWTYTREQVMEAATISRTQAGYMRKVCKALGDDAFDHDRWLQALKASRGEQPEWTEEEVAEWVEAQAERYAVRLGKEFGDKLKENPEVTARALERYFGQRLPDVLRFLDTGMEEDEMEDF